MLQTLGQRVERDERGGLGSPRKGNDDSWEPEWGQQPQLQTSLLMLVTLGSAGLLTDHLLQFGRRDGEIWSRY